VIPIKDNIPTDRFPFVTVSLIIINVVAYLLAVRHGGSLWSGPATHQVLKYGAIPDALTHPGVHCAEVVRQTVLGQGQPEVLCNTRLLNANGIAAANPLPTWQTVFTSMFMHGSFLHIAGNMIFLWIFGNNVEDSMGRIKYVFFYVLGGVAALALQVAIAPHATNPTIGASGAIAAVLGGYIVLYPRARVLTFVIIIFFVTVIELPALVMLGIWFAEQALFAAADLTNPTGGGGGVAYFAHIGGFAFGATTIKLLATNIKRVPPRIPVY
jgi:membrane associated rhomboid family serine protease